MSQNQCCDPQTQNCSGEQTKPQTHHGKECCPVESAVEKWSGAFCEAMYEVKKEILKEKIRKAWGPKMDKVGDAVLETMGAQWESMLSSVKSKVELREKIKNVFFSEK